MYRCLFVGALLLLWAATTANSENDPLVFVFVHIDPKQDVAILRPMIAPDIGVQLDTETRSLQPGSVLHCQASTRQQQAIVEGQTATITDLLLECGGHKFVVKGLDFSPRSK